MKIKIIYLFLLFFSYSTLAQKNSELTRSQIYFKDSCLYYKAINEGKKALKIAIKKKDKNSVVQSLEIIGLSYVDRYIYNDSARFFLNKALSAAKQYNLLDEIPKIELGIESNKIFEGSGENSINKLFKILNFFEKKKDLYWIIKTEENIGKLYFIQFKNDLAIKQELKIFNLCKKFDFKIEESYSSLRLAHYLIDSQRLHEANEIYKNALNKYPNPIPGFFILC